MPELVNAFAASALATLAAVIVRRYADTILAKTEQLIARRRRPATLPPRRRRKTTLQPPR